MLHSDDYILLDLNDAITRLEAQIVVAADASRVTAAAFDVRQQELEAEPDDRLRNLELSIEVLLCQDALRTEDALRAQLSNALLSRRIFILERAFRHNRIALPEIAFFDEITHRRRSEREDA